MSLPIPEVTDGERIAQLVREHRPFVWRGGVRGSSAVDRWTPTFIAERFGSRKVNVEVWPLGSTRRGAVMTQSLRCEDVSLFDYIAELSRNSGAEQRYLAEFPLAALDPALMGDLPDMQRFYGLPSWLPGALRRRAVVDPRVWIGPSGTVSSTHFDVYQNFFLQIFGRKKFTMFAPSDSYNLYYPHREFGWQFLHFSPIDAESPDVERYPRFARVHALEATLEPGDVLHIPSTWWHHVRSLSTSISINLWWLDLDCVRRSSFFLARRSWLRKRPPRVGKVAT